MKEQFEQKETAQERTRGLIEQLHRTASVHPDETRFLAYHNRLAEAGKEHPEWRAAEAWHKLVGSTLREALEFDLPDGSVSAFIEELAEEFLL